MKRKVASSLLTGLLAGGGLAVMVALLAPATAAHAATVACTAPGDLHAVSGTTTLGVQPVRVWGYNTTGAAATAPGGPTLCVNAGDTVTVTLHNDLTDPSSAPVTENTALLFQGQDMIPDRTGAAPGATRVYTFTASKPGTYLYEAGLVANGQHQVSMGLYGALIVRPAAAGQAYDSATTAFADEAVLVLSEIDPALNNAANPALFDMRKYAPRYSMINGKAHPNTDAIAATAAGNKVLLRYVNAGIQYHSMASLGADQSVIALDGSPLNLSHRAVAETFGPGQTTDVIVTTPAATTDLNRLAVYDGSLLLHNSNTAGSGGMLTFVTVPGTGPGTDTTGPVSSAVAYTAGTLTATVSDAATGGANITAAEYFIDTVGAPGSGLPMTGSGPGSVSVTASVAVPTGEHIIYVRGQDSAVPTNWGVFSSVLVNGGDATGPTTKSPTLTPTPTNGTVGVAVHATGDDTATGGSNIAAAEFTIGAGAATPMIVNIAAPVASLDATIPAATVNALAAGTHTISVRSQDAAGNWGAPVATDLVVDKTGPTTAGVSVAPSPNNGTLAFSNGTQSIRVSATMSDPISNIIAGEAFLCTTPATGCPVGANGTGIVARANDGTFHGLSEAGYADIPLSTVALLTPGNHTIYVHAKDAAGNWGTTATTTLVIDKTKPLVSTVSASPNPTQGATSVTLSVTATDASAITGGEWFSGTDPGVGNGTPITTVTGTGPYSLTVPVNVSSWNEGAYILNVRVRDAAGNWSASSSTVLNVTAPLYFSTLGNTNPPGVGGSANSADIYNWSGSAFSRFIDASAAPYGLPTGANVDGYDRVDATHFYLSFSGTNTTVPGLGAVQDEDVVYYNNGVWSLYFDGTARGLTAGNQDLDAISVIGATNGTGGTLYFSTLGNTNPTGVGGAADDADIYSWAYGATGATPFTRVIDASAAPYNLPAAANVDGFVRVDATHFYLSFSADTTNVPVLGAVQDEDVIYNNNGTWSVYFNGTAHGLTSANLDVDAFDVP
ncbi:MAG: multicopper oxidase domain-containing protein [Actinomycetota bacterium]